MKFEVFDEPRTKPKKVAVLRLRSNEDGEVLLEAVDEEGDRVRGGHFMTICTDGIYLSSGISKGIGIELGASSKLHIINPNPITKEE